MQLGRAHPVAWANLKNCPCNFEVQRQFSKRQSNSAYAMVFLDTSCAKRLGLPMKGSTLLNQTTSSSCSLNRVIPTALVSTFSTPHIEMFIFSCSMEEHLELVSLVLQRLLENKLFVKTEKCVNFLGYVIVQGQLRPDPTKTRAVEEWLEVHS